MTTETTPGMSTEITIPEIHYEFAISVNASKVLPPVNDLVEGVNTVLAKDGFDERLSVRFHLIEGVLTAKRIMTANESEIVKAIILSQFAREFPKWDVALDSFRRKGGNAKQSASQSAA